MISKLIPPQYRMLALAAAFAFVAVSSAGAGWTVNGWRLGKATAEDKLADATEAMATLVGRIEGARDRAADLETNLGGLRATAAGVRKEIANVLPKDDASCDLPAAARGLLNRSSGYADPLPLEPGPRP
jgi:hypothetical protein